MTTTITIEAGAMTIAMPERQAKIDAAWISIMGSTPAGEQPL